MFSPIVLDVNNLFNKVPAALRALVTTGSERLVSRFMSAFQIPISPLPLIRFNRTFSGVRASAFGSGRFRLSDKVSGYRLIAIGKKKGKNIDKETKMQYELIEHDPLAGRFQYDSNLSLFTGARDDSEFQNFQCTVKKQW